MLALIADVRSVLSTQMVTFGALDNAADVEPERPVPAQRPLPSNQPAPADEVQRLRTEIDRLVRLARDQEVLLTMAKRMGRIGTWAWSAKDHQLQLSEEARGIFGGGPGSLATSLARFLARVHPDDRATLSLSHGKGVDSFSRSWRVRDAAKAFRTLRIEGAPQRGPGGCLREYVGTFQDVTEQHQLLSNAQEATQRLRDRASLRPSRRVHPLPFPVLRGVRSRQTGTRLPRGRPGVCDRGGRRALADHHCNRLIETTHRVGTDLKGRFFQIQIDAMHVRPAEDTPRVLRGANVSKRPANPPLSAAG